MFMSVVGCPDLYVDACVRDNDGELLFMSIFGRDTATLKFFSAFELKQADGGLLTGNLATLDLQAEDGRKHPVMCSNPKKLEKESGKLSDVGILGPMAHAWIFDPAIRSGGMVSGQAWLIGPRTDALEWNDRVWETVKRISKIPLLDIWRDPLMKGLGANIFEDLELSNAPPLGRLTGFNVHLPANFANVISASVASGLLDEHDEGDVEERAALIALIHSRAEPDSETCDAEPVEALSVASESDKAQFELGQVVATRAFDALLAQHPHLFNDTIARHVTGDWGDVCSSDWKRNDAALARGERLVSMYLIDPALPPDSNNLFYIVTEHDRSVTTFMRHDEY
ncbi:hypothetical protein [Nitrogeniibacter aestuarii]|uniref:hypothetical protein n=1 Tax=Nitrogeniibacter aestuarii TaxID=2815343 RepID=UPI001E4F94C8|nr:hypothetical protein [Nitrogeniibacter aestuarii]